VRYAKLKTIRPPPEPCPQRAAPGARGVSRRLPALAVAAIVCLLIRPVFPAEDRVLIQGLADGEVWDTGPQALLLSRNEGDAATEGRVRLWVAGQLAPRLQGMILGRFEDGSASEYVVPDSSHAELEQAWVRYSFPSSARLVAQAGRMPQPIGSFSHRYLSNENPLIGKPVNYDIVYPYVIELAGSVGRVDFLAAVVDRPLHYQTWLPEPSSAPRPALAAGITPFTGFRLGAYATWGPYLSRDVEKYIPTGQSWRDYDQRVVGFDLHFSRGHFELNGEMTRSMFEVPGQPDERGVVWYLEPKYTWSPRWFSSLRVERNNQTSVWLPYGVDWYVTDENSWDLEVGAGFRIDPKSTVKVSYRAERSTEYPTFTPELDHSLALQFSFNFDVRTWFERPQ